MINWLKGLLNAFSKTPKVPESVDEAKVDDQVRKAKQPNRRKVPAGKSDKSAKPARVRSNNKSETSRKRTGAAVRAAAAKGKAKSKTVPKG
jgi:hypothetical protein